MRLIALLASFTLVAAVAADEPKRNPFRDGTGQGSPEIVRPAPQPEQPIRQGPRVLRAADAGVGRLIPDVAFTDLAGKSGKLSDFKNSKLLVVAFTDVGCPLCKKYGPTLARVEQEYASKDIAFLFVEPIASDAADDIKKTIAERGFTGRVIHDKNGTLTSALGAKTTTEVFVLDAARTVAYRGAIDNQYGFAYSLDAPRNTYLTAAINDLLAGKRPVVAATTAPGCELDAKPAVASELTYHARIERIVQANCIECHRKGGVAPFALETYEQVVARMAAIRRVVDAGTMPPWFAAPPANGEHTSWLNDRSLAAADKADLLAWLGSDRKKGNAADAPLPRSYATGWLIGKPDAVFQIPKPIAVKATGVMPYQKVVVETNFDDDRWVRAMEVQPTARDVVHHVLVFALAKGVRPGNGREEAQGFFAAYAPGSDVLNYPDGYAKKLPKGSTLVFQIHYTPNGTATEDQTRIGMVFADKPPRHEVRVTAAANAAFTIPPGADNHKLEGKIPYIPFDARILAYFPHAHLRGKAARYEAVLADGTKKLLLDVPRYDFNWQLTYRYAEPVVVPRGSAIVYTAWYDNSTKNPANPDPTKAVRWGPQTYEEMHLGYLEFVIDR